MILWVWGRDRRKRFDVVGDCLAVAFRQHGGIRHNVGHGRSHPTVVGCLSGSKHRGNFGLGPRAQPFLRNVGHEAGALGVDAAGKQRIGPDCSKCIPARVAFRAMRNGFDEVCAAIKRHFAVSIRSRQALAKKHQLPKSDGPANAEQDCGIVRWRTSRHFWQRHEIGVDIANVGDGHAGEAGVREGRVIVFAPGRDPSDQRIR